MVKTLKGFGAGRHVTPYPTSHTPLSSLQVAKLKAEIADTEGSIGQAFKTLDLDDDGVVSRES